jgi:5-methylcytosine-specific restriction endonuclease McrA
MSSTNGRCNSNERGSAKDRRSRKLFLLNKFGNGAAAQCWECSTLVTYATMIVDRIIDGNRGGRYTRNNIRVHCPLCSSRQGQKVTTQQRKANTCH